MKMEVYLIVDMRQFSCTELITWRDAALKKVIHEFNKWIKKRIRVSNSKEFRQTTFSSRAQYRKKVCSARNDPELMMTCSQPNQETIFCSWIWGSQGTFHPTGPPSANISLRLSAHHQLCGTFWTILQAENWESSYARENLIRGHYIELVDFINQKVKTPMKTLLFILFFQTGQTIERFHWSSYWLLSNIIYHSVLVTYHLFPSLNLTYLLQSL